MPGLLALGLETPQSSFSAFYGINSRRRRFFFPACLQLQYFMLRAAFFLLRKERRLHALWDDYF
jgi:hypothetical protein